MKFFIPLALGAVALSSGCARQTATFAQNTPPKSAKSSSPNAIKRFNGVPNPQKSPTGLLVPRGFQISVFADGLNGPRRIAFAPGATPQKYDVFVTEPYNDRIRVLRTQNGQVRSRSIFAASLNKPYGLAFGQGALYVANTDAVLRFPYRTGDTRARVLARRIARLTQGGYNQHWTRNLLLSRDGTKLYVTVGSSCNTCEEDDPQRAAISVMNPDGSGKRVFASGLRNPVGIAWRPGTSELWTVVNERDNLGDDVPPDYLTRVQKGAFYGWPYAYTDIKRRIFPDPSFGAKSPQMVKRTVAPDVPVQAHSAALGVAFYERFPSHSGGRTPRAVDDTYPLPGRRPFPREYEGDAFLAYHGSWNRSAKTGYKIVRVDFQDGKPRSVSDFVVGYLKPSGRVWGRPVDVQVAPDGSLLFSDDGGGKIWRVTYTGKK